MSDKDQDYAWRTLSRQERVACPYQPRPPSKIFNVCYDIYTAKSLLALFHLPQEHIFDQRRALKNRARAHSWKSRNFCIEEVRADQQKRGAEVEERVENALCCLDITNFSFSTCIISLKNKHLYFTLRMNN
jgi:hypothetical protein